MCVPSRALIRVQSSDGRTCTLVAPCRGRASSQHRQHRCAEGCAACSHPLPGAPRGSRPHHSFSSGTHRNPYLTASRLGARVPVLGWSPLEVKMPARRFSSDRAPAWVKSTCQQPQRMIERQWAPKQPPACVAPWVRRLIVGPAAAALPAGASQPAHSAPEWRGGDFARGDAQLGRTVGGIGKTCP